MTTETEQSKKSNESTDSKATFTLREALDAAYQTQEQAPEEDASPPASDEEETAEVEASEEAQPDETQSEESAEETADEQETEVETILPPENWSDEWRTTFKGLPDEGKQLALDQWTRMQSDYTKKTEEIADLRKAIEPYQDQIRLSGMSPGNVIQRLFAAQAMLQKDPVQGIQWLMRSYNVAPDKIVPQPTSDDDEYVDPTVKRLSEELKELRAEREAERQRAAQQQSADGNRILDDFRNATNEDGTKAHPHVDQVLMPMASLMQADPSLTLDEAYNRAVWTLPEVKEKMLKAEKEKLLKEAQERTEKERKEQVKKAKQSQTKLKGKQTGAVTEDKPKTLKEIIAAAAAQHGG